MAAAPKLAIAPVGTCRIHGPIRKGVPRYPIRAHTLRNYGFVHTSAEALQQLRFMFGMQSVPAEVQRLTFRPTITQQALQRPFVPADVYLVELSSRKLLTVGEHAIQTNYMGRYFGDFFADRNRARMFWAMALVEQQAQRRAWLDTDPVFQRLSADDRDLLASIARRVQSDDEIQQEMAQIVEIVGKDKLVFVTHVDAKTPDNTVIAQRHRLIELVKATAARLQVPCYDPTPAMQALGQSNALEHGGLDLTHYTGDFAERLFDDWYARYFLGRIDSASPSPIGPRVDTVDPVAAIDAAWIAGALCDASRRVHAVLRTNAAHAEHRMLLARMQAELGDYESAIAHAETARGEDGPAEQADEVLMQCYFELGRYPEAHRVATGLLGDERETAEILRICALSATHMGEREMAVVNWKRLFRLAPDDAEAASAVLELLEASGDGDAVANWVDEVREALPSHGPSYAAQWKRHVSSGDRVALRLLADQAPRLEDRAALSLADLAVTEGFAVAAAVLIETQDLIAKGNADAARWISAHIPQWLSDAQQALERNDLGVAVDRIRASCLLNSTSRPVMRMEKVIARHLHKEARVAFSEKNYPWLIEVIDCAVEARLPFPEMYTYRGRAAAALGDVDTAVHYLRRAADEPGAPLSALLHLARVATRADCFKEAIDSYTQIAADGTVDEPARDEALRQLDILRTRCVRAARELNARGEHDKSWALLGLIEHEVDVTMDRKRVLSALYGKMRSLDSSETNERAAIARTILRLDPNDHVALKTSAIAAMHMHRYSEALSHWQTLRRLSDSADYIESNIKRCETLIERANRPTKAVRKPLVPAD